MPENWKLSWKPSVWKSKNKMSEIFTLKWARTSSKESVTMNSLLSWLQEWVQEIPKMKSIKSLNFLMKTTLIKSHLKTWKESPARSVKKFQMKNWKKCSNKQTEMVMVCSISMSSIASWEEGVILLMISTAMMNE